MPSRRAVDIATLRLVSTKAASTSGELLAWSALRLWRLSAAEQAVPRMRALIAGAVAATVPLRRLDARLVLLHDVLILEVVFLDSEPNDFDEDLMPIGAQWSWHRNDRGRWCLRDELSLRHRAVGEFLDRSDES